MGSYRFTLSILVLISHIGISFKGYNPGVVAVISFYLLSGYVMTGLVTTHYSSLDRIKFFYIDRFCRIFPQFIFYSISTLVTVKILDINSPFLADLNIFNIFLNLLMLPQGYYMFNGMSNALLIPQSWSLGLELTFYLLYPFILLSNKIKLIAVISLALFIIAYFGIINTDYYGYRLIPGTLFIFFIGTAYHSSKKLGNLYVYIILCLSLLLYVNLFFSNSLFSLTYNKEVLLGIIIGIASLFILKKMELKNKFDNILGDLSFGIFLNHFLIIFLIEKFSIHSITHKSNIAILLISSLTLSLITYYFIEKPFLYLRKKYRKSLK